MSANTYSFLCSNVPDRPRIFVTDADGKLVYLWTFDFGAAYIEAGRAAAALAKDVTEWQAWDSEPIDDDARELYEYAVDEGVDLAKGDNETFEVMTPGDLINYMSSYSFYEFIMAFYLEVYRDDVDNRHKTPSRDFCGRFLATVDNA